VRSTARSSSTECGDTGASPGQPFSGKAPAPSLPKKKPVQAFLHTLRIKKPSARLLFASFRRALHCQTISIEMIRSLPPSPNIGFIHRWFGGDAFFFPKEQTVSADICRRVPSLLPQYRFLFRGERGDLFLFPKSRLRPPFLSVKPISSIPVSFGGVRGRRFLFQRSRPFPLIFAAMFLLCSPNIGFFLEGRGETFFFSQRKRSPRKNLIS